MKAKNTFGGSAEIAVTRLLRHWIRGIASMSLVAGIDQTQATQTPPIYHEAYRPQFHYSPPRNWMNDPNGMVFLNGEYHLFYQHNPADLVWGPMHWGHATSRDLVHWINHPVALAPDALGMIFSGSVVYDRLNTSGLGSRAKPPLVALYTSHDESMKRRGSKLFERQSLAYSLDEGRTWQKFRNNPVLPNPGHVDFRDPKVFWHPESNRWFMVLALTDHVTIFSSSDLMHWAHESDFGTGEGAHGGVWECPDLFPLRVEGTSERRYVLLVSINPGGANSTSGTQYFVGRFDGHQFELETPARPAASWLDYGTDNYAGVTWSDAPVGDDRRIFLGWMSNWLYGSSVPTQPWRGSMTVPRELTLTQDAHGWLVRSMPVAELSRLRRHSSTIEPYPGRGPVYLLDAARLPPSSGWGDIELNLDCQGSSLVNLKLTNSNGERLVFRINRKQMRYELDRSQSGATDFNLKFSEVQVAPIRGQGSKVSLRLLLDASSVEIFINQGETTMTALNFPSVPFQAASLEADVPLQVISGNAWTLDSIWHSL